MARLWLATFGLLFGRQVPCGAQNGHPAFPCTHGSAGSWAAPAMSAGFCHCWCSARLPSRGFNVAQSLAHTALQRVFGPEPSGLPKKSLASQAPPSSTHPASWTQQCGATAGQVTLWQKRGTWPGQHAPADLLQVAIAPVPSHHASRSQGTMSPLMKSVCRSSNGHWAGYSKPSLASLPPLLPPRLLWHTLLLATGLIHEPGGGCRGCICLGHPRCAQLAKQRQQQLVGSKSRLLSRGECPPGSLRAPPPPSRQRPEEKILRKILDMGLHVSATVDFSKLKCFSLGSPFIYFLKVL